MRLNSYRNVRVPNLSVRIMRDVLVSAGIDPMSAFSSSGIPPGSADLTGAAVTGAQEFDFQSSFVDLTSGRPDLWVQAGRRYSFAAFGVHGLALMTAPTLEHFAAVTLIADLNFSLAEFSVIADPEGRGIGLRFTYPGLDADLVPFSVCRDVTAILLSVAALTRTTLAPLTRLSVPLPEVPAELAALSPVAIELSGPDVRLEWSPQIGSQPLPAGDLLQHMTYLREAQEHVRQFRLEQDWARQVINAIVTSQTFGASLAEIAALLHLSPRTLQRKLESTGDSFRDLRDLARFEAASRLLTDTNASIGEISRRVGYEEPANFTVAFKRWSGRLPSDYRAAPTM